MLEDPFEIDARIVADSVALAEGPLSHLRLMDDARFPWLVLLPRRVGLTELTQLDAADMALVMEEVRVASAALRSVAPFEKLNLGALGNIVSQLHVHIVGRSVGDAAWPGPVWGSGPRQPRRADEGAVLVARLADKLGDAGWRTH